METKLLTPTIENIELACNLLKNGEIVGIPTETVYGIAGDTKNDNAIKKIFIAKGRPQDNPLIVHISNLDMLKDVVKFVPEDAKILAKHFWPGPLTIIMPKGKNVCASVSCRLDTVGVRMPNHKIALEIIEKCGLPLSAPSANISGKPSPTTAIEVYKDMNGKIPLIIDGGECEAGIESTVISCVDANPIILRPGVITKEDIEAVLQKEVLIASAVTNDIKKDEKILSPGMKYKHYAPNADITLIKSDLNSFIEYVKKQNDADYILCFDNESHHFDIPTIEYGKIDDPKSQAKKLFACLRTLDTMSANKVYARCPETKGVGLAVYNRLIRSAGFKIISL